MIRELPSRQEAVLRAVESYWSEFGLPPSLADLASALGVSRQTVHEHVAALRRKGFLEHLEGTGRTLRPVAGEWCSESTRVPIVGRVAAGEPVFAQENIEGWIVVDDMPAIAPLFALRVRGDSMTGAGILDGDLVVVRQQSDADDGDTVVALVDDEDATVKRIKRRGGMIHLVAMNPAFGPIVVSGDRVRVQGKVVGVRRNLDG